MGNSEKNISNFWIFLQANTLSNINKYCDNLISLSIDSCGQILPVHLPLVPTKEEREDSCFAHFHSSKKDSADEDKNDNHSYIEQGFILNTPKLKRLCITNLSIDRGPSYFSLILNHQPGKKPCYKPQ